jgi:hypothetical protein
MVLAQLFFARRVHTCAFMHIWYTVENADLAPCEPFPMCVGFQLWSSSLVLWLHQNNQ